MAFTLVQISLPIVATVGQPPAGNPPLGCQVQLVGLLDHLLIALTGIPRIYSALHCSITAHSYVCNHLGLTSPTSFAYCSHLSNAATDIWPNGDRFRQVPLYYYNKKFNNAEYIISIFFYYNSVSTSSQKLAPHPIFSAVRLKRSDLLIK